MVKKQKLKKPIIILLVILISYSWVWLESYQRTKLYYQNALENFHKGRYITAIKGERVLKEDRSGYVFKGGFQQVETIWSSKYAFPRPGLYAEAKKKIDLIINKKIDIEMGENAFHQYFRLDNKYLPQILLRVGDLHLKEGNIDKARKAYDLVRQAFSRKQELAKQAEDKLGKLKTNNI